VATLRIPFAEAISEPRLLGPLFDLEVKGSLSLAQQVALKVFYGCELSRERVDDRGWSEVDHYFATQGCATFDELGFIQAITVPDGLTYTPQEYREGWAVWGVRAGKTDCFATIITCYEATCGGHEEFKGGKPLVCFQIAQDLRLAQYSLHSIKSTLDRMPFMTKPLKGGGNRVQGHTAQRIDLWNGITIGVVPPTVKSIRGYDCPSVTMDEVGVWYTESDSANPDFAVYNQASSRQAQFEFPKIVGISSPWSKQGMLYERWVAGTDGRKIQCDGCRKLAVVGCPACLSLRRPHQNRLVLHGTTASLGNPLIKRPFLQGEHDKDPRAFAREYLGQFQDSISGFLSSTLLQKAVTPGVLTRPPQPSYVYVAAADPAFRRDAFGFCIAHSDGEKVVVDLTLRFLPSKDTPINPREVLATIAPLMQAYKVFTLYTDQFHFESLRQLAMDYGMAIEGVTFTAGSKAAIYGNLQNLLNTGRLVLTDDREVMKELSSIERTLSQKGGISIEAPAGQHDDMATVVALAAHKAVWMVPMVPKDDQEAKDALREKTPFEMVQAQLKRQKQAVEIEW
jgi:hypothetical protein